MKMDGVIKNVFLEIHNDVPGDDILQNSVKFVLLMLQYNTLKYIHKLCGVKKNITTQSNKSIHESISKVILKY